ncbi:hypothetical protein D3C81_1716110 [compost metagenome]
MTQFAKHIRITLAHIAEAEVESDHSSNNLQRQEHTGDKVLRADPGQLLIKLNYIQNIDTHAGQNLLLVLRRGQISIIVAFAHNILGMRMKGHHCSRYTLSPGQSYSGCNDAGMSAVQSVKLAQGRHLRLCPPGCGLQRHWIA